MEDITLHKAYILLSMAGKTPLTPTLVYEEIGRILYPSTYHYSVISISQLLRGELLKGKLVSKVGSKGRRPRYELTEEGRAALDFYAERLICNSLSSTPSYPLSLEEIIFLYNLLPSMKDPVCKGFKNGLKFVTQRSVYAFEEAAKKSRYSHKATTTYAQHLVLKSNLDLVKDLLKSFFPK